MSDELYAGAAAERERLHQRQADFDAEFAANVIDVTRNPDSDRDLHSMLAHADCTDDCEVRSTGEWADAVLEREADDVREGW